MPITWTVCPDATMLEQAETDLRRALILQNSRTAKRLDPASKLRTHRNEARLRRFGLILCAAGLVLALVLLVGAYAAYGSVEPVHAGLLVAFIVLLPVFVALPRLRQAGMRRVDAMLARRAKKVLRAWPEGTKRDYAIEDGKLTSTVDGEQALARALDGLVYGLLGDAAWMLYTSPKKQTPALVVLVGSEGERLAGALTSVRTEALSRDLLPKTTVERSW